MRDWMEIVPILDKEVYKKAGYGARAGAGQKPAVLVIDVTQAFVGDKREPILKSIERFPNSCGESGWDAVDKIKELIDCARRNEIQVIYTADDFENKIRAGRWADKNSRILEKANLGASNASMIPHRIAPDPKDLVIRKLKPSAFFGTPLASLLITIGVDTLIVTGCTTSGCVRASVIDAFSYNFRVLVVEECTFDRGELSHKVNLFDMQQKYGDVISISEAKLYMESVARQSGAV